MPSQTEIRHRINDQIIAALKSGKLPPWRQPWTSNANSGFPTNVLSRRSYSGINPLLLQIAAQKHDFKSKWWGTFKQWESIGGKVKHRPTDVQPGCWGTAVIFWKPVEKVEIDPDTGKEKTRSFGFLKQYHLFNLDQVEGSALDHLRVTDTIVVKNDFIDFEPAEEAIAATGADIRYGGHRAFYRRPVIGCDSDFVQMPAKESFSPPKEYYATVLHELMHWSEYRLDWKGSYAEGELRAEIAACYVSAELGVPQSDDLSNHHAYLENWLAALQSDPRFIFAASTAASKAADFVLSFSRTPKKEPASEEVIAN
jgi:antirestriction protein ArdC